MQDITSDETLVREVLQRRNHAVEALYDRYAPGLLGLCCRYCECREDAEDVLHEGFMKILKNLPSFRARNGGSLLAWMKRIMVNTALNHLRDRHRKLTVPDQYTADKETETQEEPGFFESMSGRITSEAILRMITELPAGYRAVFNMYVFEGYSHREIASVVHCSESTSKSQLSKARAMLRKKIEQVLQQENISAYGKE